MSSSNRPFNHPCAFQRVARRLGLMVPGVVLRQAVEVDHRGDYRISTQQRLNKPLQTRICQAVTPLLVDGHQECYGLEPRPQDLVREGGLGQALTQHVDSPQGSALLPKRFISQRSPSEYSASQRSRVSELFRSKMLSPFTDSTTTTSSGVNLLTRTGD